MTPEERREIYRRCTRFVDRHPRQTPRQVLGELASWTPPETRTDMYGAGGPVATLEAKVAELLGHEAAVFMPSGTMAQAIALRLWCEARRRTHVAFHPLCHLEVHEHRGYQHLHGLTATPLGSALRPVEAGDIAAVTDPLGAVLLELPQRDLGGVLPPWEELAAQLAAIRAKGAAAHLDGARLWECQPYYGRPLAEIAGLFDSAYVSFYKTLGAISGACLVGPRDFVAGARIWQRRQGGNVVHLYPEALSALKALSVRLPRVPTYVKAAKRLAEVMAGFERVRVAPARPQVNMFQAYFRGDRERLLDAFATASGECGLAFVTSLAPAEVPGWWRTEVTAGECSVGVTDGELRGLLERVFELA